MAANEKTCRPRAVNKLVATGALLAVICFPILLFSQDSDVSGVVRDVAGTPLAGVGVYGKYHFPAGGADRRDTKTDAQGRFALKNVGRVIFFVAAKYEVLTRLRRADESSVEITLKPSAGSYWPDKCATKKEPGGKRYGTMFLFFVPNGAKTEHHSDTDTWDLIVKFPHTKTKEQLVLWSGPTLGSAFVPEETVLNAKSFTQQDFDWRGTDQNGQNWRWNSSIKDLIHYENASDDAAKFFDRIIDSACLRNFDK